MQVVHLEVVVQLEVLVQVVHLEVVVQLEVKRLALLRWVLVLLLSKPTTRVRVLRDMLMDLHIVMAFALEVVLKDLLPKLVLQKGVVVPGFLVCCHRCSCVPVCCCLAFIRRWLAVEVEVPNVDGLHLEVLQRMRKWWWGWRRSCRRWSLKVLGFRPMMAMWTSRCSKVRTRRYMRRVMCRITRR